MALLDSLIVASCVGLSGQANEACNKALEASAKQSGVEQNADKLEGHELKLYEQKAKDVFGNDAVSTAGGAIWLTKVVVEKKASFGICRHVNFEYSPDLSRLVLKWTY